jgi:membrane protein
VAGPMNDMSAGSPAEISQRGWRDVLRRSSRAMAAQNMSLSAAGIAFYVVCAFFPALAMIVVLAALLLGKAQVLVWLSTVRLDMPESFNITVTSQLDAIADRSRGLSIVSVLGAFAFSLWSGMYGARALIIALNLVYHERERRSFWHRQALALGFCLLGGAFVLGALTLIVGLAGLDFRLGSMTGSEFLAPTRWPVLIVATLLLLSVAYRYGPCRRAAKWRWVTWGATVSATIWVTGSSLLSYYAAHFAQLNPLLGSLGLVMLFLFWCYLTVLIVLFGAQINAELERHTEKDTGAGEPRPPGQRGAAVADAHVKR